MIDCVVCLQRMKPPIKVLSCGHSFCFRCVRQMRRQSRMVFGQKYNKMSCPTCRHETLLPRGRTSMLPNNFALHDVLEAHKDQNPDAKTDTNSCEPLDKDGLNDTITPSSETSSESEPSFYVEVDDDDNGYEGEEWWDDVAPEDEEESEFDGNWFCPNELCHYYNFAFRLSCRWCRTARPFGYENFQQLSSSIDQVFSILNQEQSNLVPTNVVDERIPYVYPR